MSSENERIISYGDAMFVPKCEICGRYVKADDEIEVCEEHGLKDVSNATCKKCGRVQMFFLGFI